MSLNRVIIEGRIPFDLEVKNSGEKNAFIGSKVSVRRNYKPEGEQYYPEDLISFRAFGGQADLIGKHFSKSSFIILEGELRVSDDWTDGEGNKRNGETYLHVTGIHFPLGVSKNGNSESEEEEPKSSKKVSGAKGGNPLTSKKKGLPFK